jgi:cyanate permease
MDGENSIKVYSYRWVVLLVFMLMASLTQLLWITFAPITGAAAQFFGTSDLSVGILSMCFMVVYIIVVLPSAWVIDTYGFRVAVGIGSALTAVFALTRGIFAANYWVVLVSQIGIAIGQPLIIGSITKVAARWFPISERATAAGLGTLSLYLGILVAMILTPNLTVAFGIRGMLIIYGIAAVVAAVVFSLFAREKPSTPPCAPGHEERVLMFDGLKQMLRQRDFIMLMVIFFVGLGMFNCVSTWIENIVRPRGFTISQAGMLGGLMLIGGVVGAVVMPILSDKLRRRKVFILIALIGLIPGLAGMTLFRSYLPLLVSGFVFGYFLLSAGPIGFQYGAEITYPAPEGTSNNLLLVTGQISGIVFIFGMDMLKSPATGSMTTSLLMLIGLAVVSILLCTMLKESPVSDRSL